MSIQNYNLFVYAALFVVLAVLVAGIINFAFTGKKALNRSNKLMRLRVIAQFVAVVLIMIGFWLKVHAQ